MERLVRFLLYETCHLNVFAFGLRCSEFDRYQLHSCETNSLIRNPAIHKRRLKNNHAAISPHSEPSVLLTSQIADLRNGKQSTTKVNAATNAYHPCGLGMRLIFIFLANVLAHLRRDESLKIKLDACRRRMERLVRVKGVSATMNSSLPVPSENSAET
jgi:hypothetical protein